MNIPLTITGNLGRDVEIRQTKQGKWVSNLTVAVTPREKKNGEWTDAETIWFKVTLWDNLPEILYTKGSKVIVSGELYQETYEKDGTSIKSLVIKADTVAKVERYDRSESAPQSDQFKQPTATQDWSTPTSNLSDNTPF
jgi:single-strand DNA-binding protein